MKISGFQSRSARDDAMIILLIVAVFILCIWFASPPKNKALQMCYWGYKIKSFYLKKTRNVDINKYRYHVNNAVYLIKLYRKEPWSLRRALTEMDLAIESFPSAEANNNLKNLYKKRANIKLIAEDYKGALVDYSIAGNLDFNESLRVAILYTKLGKYDEATRDCTNLIQRDASTHVTFACLANVLIQKGQYNEALRLYNISVDRNPNNAQAYMDRAKLKKIMKNEAGYKSDLAIAHEISPLLKEDFSYMDSIITPDISALEYEKY